MHRARGGPLRAAPGNISAILSAVRNPFLFLAFLAISAAAAIAFPAVPAHSYPQQAPPQSSPPPAPPPQSPSQSEQPSPLPSQPAPTAPPMLPPQAPAGPVIVLDPAHGGTDTGARGQNGAVEKDLVLQIVRTMHAELDQQGYRVITTRNDDSNPSYDDRAAMANTYRDSVFVSIHVSSTGTAGRARAYYDRFETPIPAASALAGAGATAPVAQAPNSPARSLIAWNEAQRPVADASHRLADLIQIQLVQVFAGSPTVSTGAAIRTLRSVAGPAVAIELSSVSASSPDSLAAAAAPIAKAIARSVAAFRQGNSGGAR
jgi:N-acetylmuramoyl-L-alanine amidase